MPLRMQSDILRQIGRLRRESKDGVYEWVEDACSGIIDLCYHYGPIIVEIGIKNDIDRFLDGLMGYQQLVVSGVRAALDRPHLEEQHEFVEEVELFVVEIMRDAMPYLDTSDIEKDLINLLLETIWNAIQVIRPPPA
jgi:hypothetical protein